MERLRGFLWRQGNRERPVATPQETVSCVEFFLFALATHAGVYWRSISGESSAVRHSTSSQRESARRATKPKKRRVTGRLLPRHFSRPFKCSDMDAVVFVRLSRRAIMAFT